MNHVVCSCAYLKRKALTPRDRKNLSSVLSEDDFTVSEVGTEDLTVRFSQPGGDLRALGLENWKYHAPRDTMNSEGKALFCAISSRKSLDQLFCVRRSRDQTLSTKLFLRASQVQDRCRTVSETKESSQRLSVLRAPRDRKWGHPLRQLTSRRPPQLPSARPSSTRFRPIRPRIPPRMMSMRVYHLYLATGSTARKHFSHSIHPFCLRRALRRCPRHLSQSPLHQSDPALTITGPTREHVRSSLSNVCRATPRTRRVPQCAASWQSLDWRASAIYPSSSFVPAHVQRGVEVRSSLDRWARGSSQEFRNGQLGFLGPIFEPAMRFT